MSNANALAWVLCWYQYQDNDTFARLMMAQSIKAHAKLAEVESPSLSKRKD